MTAALINAVTSMLIKATQGRFNKQESVMVSLFNPLHLDMTAPVADGEDIPWTDEAWSEENVAIGAFITDAGEIDVHVVPLYDPEFRGGQEAADAKTRSRHAQLLLGSIPALAGLPKGSIKTPATFDKFMVDGAQASGRNAVGYFDADEFVTAILSWDKFRVTVTVKTDGSWAVRIKDGRTIVWEAAGDDLKSTLPTPDEVRDQRAIVAKIRESRTVNSAAKQIASFDALLPVMEKRVETLAKKARPGQNTPALDRARESVKNIKRSRKVFVADLADNNPAIAAVVADRLAARKNKVVKVTA